MTYIRRLILALALSAGLAPAFAQVAPPVPALPDTERRTTYSISASTCACNVNFALYGDSTDYANWIEVFVNGVRMAQAGNWTLSSATGTIGSIPLPITNAVLTFTAPQTGTIQIVGARRPRRTSQFNEGAGVPTRNFNVVLSDLTAQNRELWDKTNDVTGRAVLAPPGETLALLPVLASRLNMGACFNSSGNLVACVSIPSSTFTAGSGISLTGVSPTTIAADISAGAGIALTGTHPVVVSVINPYNPLSSATITGASTTFTSAQNNTVVNRSNSAAPMSDILPGTSPGVLPASTVITVTNVDTAGVLSIKVGAGATFKTQTATTGFIYICPGQTVRFYSDGANYWAVDLPTYCKMRAAATIFIATTGSATNDGLTVSTPLLDPTFAYNLVQSNFDLNKNTLTFKLADGAYGPINMNGPIIGALFDRYSFGVAWLGNSGTPANVTLTLSATNPPALGAIQATNGATGSFNGFQVASATVDNISIYYNSQISIQNIIFKGGRVGGMHMISVANSLITIIGNYTINPTTTAGCHMMAIDAGVIELLNPSGTTTVTLTGTPAFTSGFACVQYPSNIVMNTAVTYSGAATGQRYNGTFNGTINTAGGGASFFPGNAVGVLSTGAQYN